ncbi:MAG: preprotein translocase subunit YajC [Paludibacteraceae bacterium]|nr:preprotein translocase subunit YajC [Paludibacteraceae bacterium]
MQLNILLQAASGGVGSIVMIVLMIVVFYFFLIRPQKKRQKEIQEFQNSVKSGTKVVTSGGIYGTVKEVKEKYFVVEIADNVRISIDKASVFAVPTVEEKK